MQPALFVTTPSLQASCNIGGGYGISQSSVDFNKIGMQPSQFVTTSSMSQAGNIGGVYDITQLAADFKTKVAVKDPYQEFLDQFNTNGAQESKTAKEKIFKNFQESGTHGGIWPKITWGVIELQASKKIRIFRTGVNNKQKQHMEFFLIQAMIKELNLQGYVGPFRFKFYTSYSPCANCANNFLMFQKAIFVKHGCYITIEIVAAAPYKTYRVSCPTCREIFFYKNNFEEYLENTFGLRILSSNKMCVRAFSYQDWTKLAELLGLALPGLGTDYYPYSMYANKQIGPTARHNLHHTRKEADVAAHMDFNFILLHPIWIDIEDVTDLSKDVLKKILADASSLSE